MSLISYGSDNPALNPTDSYRLMCYWNSNTFSTTVATGPARLVSLSMTGWARLHRALLLSLTLLRGRTMALWHLAMSTVTTTSTWPW